MCVIHTELLRPESTGVYGTLFTPADRPPQAAVLLIGGSGGTEPDYLAKPLAQEGVAALSVAYFGKPGLPPGLCEIEIGYFAKALTVLHTRVGRPDVGFVVLGQSRGSEAAVLTAAHFPDLVDAAAVTVPSNVVLGGYPMGGPAWLLDGAPIPYAEDVTVGQADARVRLPVQKVKGPVMFVSAGRDEVWPSGPMAKAMSDRLASCGPAHPYTLLEYNDATHTLGYLRPELPAGLLPAGLQDPPPTQAARADAWPKLLGFIRGVAAH